MDLIRHGVCEICDGSEPVQARNARLGDARHSVLFLYCTGIGLAAINVIYSDGQLNSDQARQQEEVDLLLILRDELMDGLTALQVTLRHGGGTEARLSYRSGKCRSVVSRFTMAHRIQNGCKDVGPRLHLQSCLPREGSIGRKGTMEDEGRLS